MNMFHNWYSIGKRLKLHFRMLVSFLYYNFANFHFQTRKINKIVKNSNLILHKSALNYNSLQSGWVKTGPRARSTRESIQSTPPQNFSFSKFTTLTHIFWNITTGPHTIKQNVGKKS